MHGLFHFIAAAGLHAGGRVSRNQNFIVSVCAAGDNLALSREANQCQELQVEGCIMLENCLALVLYIPT